MAHATHDWTRGIIQQIKRVCNEAGRQIGIMMDIKGPEIQAGDIGDAIYLEVGELFDASMTIIFGLMVSDFGEDEANCEWGL
jgi:pyruvate kinase